MKSEVSDELGPASDVVITVDMLVDELESTVLSDSDVVVLEIELELESDVDTIVLESDTEKLVESRRLFVSVVVGTVLVGTSLVVGFRLSELEVVIPEKSEVVVWLVNNSELVVELKMLVDSSDV